MGQPSSKDEMTIRHQFDRLCQMALKGEAVNYYKHMDYRRKHEVTFSELSEKELGHMCYSLMQIRKNIEITNSSKVLRK